MNFKDWTHALDRGNPISRINRLSFLLVGLALTLSISGVATAQPSSSGCGPISGGIDYRTAKKSELNIVESFHFTPSVENLISGSTSTIGGDLDYTLRHFPNHHRALMAMMRLGEKLKTTQPPGARYSVECWFERALRFRPNDAIVRMIYAKHLSKSARKPEAIQQLEQATAFAKDNAFSHYNIGLIYFDLKDYDKALMQAHKAISLGFLQPALRSQLQSVGKWTEPANESPDGANRPENSPTRE